MNDASLHLYAPFLRFVTPIGLVELEVAYIYRNLISVEINDTASQFS